MAGRVVVFGWAESAHVQRWTAAMVARGFEVRLISLGGQPLACCETFCLPRKSRWSYLTQVREAAKLAREFRPDLVHVHYAGGFSYWGLRSRVKPLIVSVWGADVIDLPGNTPKQWFIRFALKRATRITATSRFLRGRTINLLPEAAAKTEVIPFGVDVPSEIATPPDGPVRLCYIKSHRPKYGPDILLKAMARVRETIPDVTLSLAGRGEMTEELKQLAKDLRLEDAVDFTGFVPNAEIYSFIRRHHIMVMPSVMESESFGVAVLEASACGRPVIASRIGGVPEVLENGQTGILVPPDDVDSLAGAILDLANRPEKREKIGRNGYEFVREHYGWNVSVDKMTALYEELIGG